MPELRDGGMLIDLECVQRCVEGSASCPEGQFCWGTSCRPYCDPGGPDTCGPDHKCIAIDHERKGVCRLP